MAKDISVQTWLDRGYRRYEVNSGNRYIMKNCDFMLQKCFEDEKGKRYFITVYCYDRKNYPTEHQVNQPKIGYMATSQFVIDDNRPFFNIEMNSIDSIEEMEQYYELFWETLKRPYYEPYIEEF